MLKQDTAIKKELIAGINVDFLCIKIFGYFMKNLQ